jgi:hypothetical protein
MSYSDLGVLGALAVDIFRVGQSGTPDCQIAGSPSCLMAEGWRDANVED